MSTNYLVSNIALPAILLLFGFLDKILQVTGVIREPWAPGFHVFCGIVLSIFVAWNGYQNRPSKRNKELLERQLVVFLKVLELPFAKTADIRCNIWTPERASDKREIYLNAVTRYMPGESYPSIARLNSAKGIVGRTYRTGQAQSELAIMEREAYTAHLVTMWSFSRDEASRILKDRVTRLAAPIREGDNIIGVVYIDSGSLDLLKGHQDVPALLSRIQTAAMLLEPALRVE